MKRRQGTDERGTIPMRVARRGDRWVITKALTSGLWIAEPKALAVWSTRSQKQTAFSTHAYAISYAQRRATQR